MNKHLIIALVCYLCLIGCKDDGKDPGKFDPSQPVVFTDFTPKEGSVRTRMYITGSNFGSDVSKIHINIGGQEAKTIGVDGKKIYCMVPSRSYNGNVTVRIDGADGQPVAEHTFDDTFTYHTKQVVGTLLRKVDEDGNSAFQDGSFDDPKGGSVPSNDWLVFDPKAAPGEPKQLFSSNHSDGLRVLDLTNRTVRRLFPRTQYKTMMSFTFTADGDTLLFPDDNGRGDTKDLPNIYYALRSENFRKVRPYNYGTCSYGCVSLKDGSIFYSTWIRGGVYKMTRNSDVLPNMDTNAKWCFELAGLVQIDGAHTRLLLHPSEKYMYLFAPQRGAIMRSDYNERTKMFEMPRVIAGSMTQQGCTEGVGSSARFREPWAGVFVKNRDYEAAGKEEIYDFYFCDYAEHCIWKVTPEGVSTIVAGRSNYTADGKVWGYIDGDPLFEARFNKAAGLTYDPDTETFYIGDIDNRALRYMATE